MNQVKAQLGRSATYSENFAHESGSLESEGPRSTFEDAGRSARSSFPLAFGLLEETQGLSPKMLVKMRGKAGFVVLKA